ncbi:ABC transporter permease [Desulfohalovibrio reitneri]|uniref:ABC transporter permease n=1 Tax=Desulfohalovibrio reitneri TaxID=1307759 RepID=UPI0004A7648E|nr:FtsX-like permease family protein [Desulfohalovibrio reitneri]
MNSANQGGGFEQDVRKEVVLPFRKSLDISIKSLKVRFFRNCITVMTLVLAVAFLSFILVSADIASGLLDSGLPNIRLQLEDAGFDVPTGAEDVGSGAKSRWIVVLSLLVCAVGIVNAQLMAVTERFREIGTMKCLGALDSFVLRLFLLEAGMQGVAGALIGAVLGGLIGLLVGLLRFGWSAMVHMPGLDFVLSLLASVGIGLGLSLIGVFYPALVAARMRPVEAMRAEE